MPAERQAFLKSTSMNNLARKREAEKQLDRHTHTGTLHIQSDNLENIEHLEVKYLHSHSRIRCV